MRVAPALPGSARGLAAPPPSPRLWGTSRRAAWYLAAVFLAHVAEGCTFPTIIHPGGVPRGTKVALAFSRAVVKGGGGERTSRIPDAVVEDLKKRIGAGGLLRFVPVSQEKMSTVGYCGDCLDRAVVAGAATRAGADAVLCVDLRVEISPEGDTGVTCVRLTRADGTLLWQDRAESHRREGMEHTPATDDLVEELSFRNDALLAKSLAALCGMGTR